MNNDIKGEIVIEEKSLNDPSFEKYLDFQLSALKKDIMTRREQILKHE